MEDRQRSGLVMTRIADAASLEAHLPSLRHLLQRCVNDDPSTSSVGFLAPLSDEAAIRYWLSVVSSPARPLLLVATHPDVPLGGVLATVQVWPAAASRQGSQPNPSGETERGSDGGEREQGLDGETHAHRGSVRKLLVHPTYRRHGFGRLMLEEAERLARDGMGLDVLVLDAPRDAARELYTKGGWTEWGTCPEWAAAADGRRHATSFFVKNLRD